MATVRVFSFPPRHLRPAYMVGKGKGPGNRCITLVSFFKELSQTFDIVNKYYELLSHGKTASLSIGMTSSTVVTLNLVYHV